MVCYKVEVLIDHDIEKKYQSWLKEHINQMMEFKGFLDSILLKEKQSEKIKFIVMYYISSKDYYNDYIKNYATEKRADIPKEFINKFSINRNLLQIL